MNKSDLIGKKFGNWTVITPDPAIHKTRDKRWICQCDCGKSKSVLQKYLLNGKSTSCGCSRKKDLAGQKFGFLTVLETLYGYEGSNIATYKCQCDCGNITYVKSTSIYKTKTCGKCNLYKNEEGKRYGNLTITKMLYKYNERNETFCECQCDCGNTVTVRLTSLHTGNTTSCGCLHSPSLVGNKYGKLLVLEESASNSPQRMWKCQCECGNITYVKSYTLTSGHTTSCGCTRSEKNSLNEVFISNFLKSQHVEFIPEKSFENCIGIGGRHLRFDFFLPKYNVCIEYDGKQHFQPIEYFGGEEGFNRTKANDGIKTIFCSKNNISLYRFNYKMSQEEIQSNILSIIQKPVTTTA